MLDFDAIDEYVNFRRLHEVLHEKINSIRADAELRQTLMLKLGEHCCALVKM